MVTENLFSKVVALEAERSGQVAEHVVAFLGMARGVVEGECVAPDVGEVGAPDESYEIHNRRKTNIIKNDTAVVIQSGITLKAR